MAKQNLGGVYANMDFPPYEYREYPKHIRIGTGGKFEVVNNPKEEEAVLATIVQRNEAYVQEQEIAERDPVHEALLAQAMELGIPFNRKWSIKKLNEVISEAQKAADDLPPEENISVGLVDETSSSIEESKDELIAQAKALGINANKLWGIPRLKQEIEAANAE